MKSQLSVAKQVLHAGYLVASSLFIAYSIMELVRKRKKRACKENNQKNLKGSSEGQSKQLDQKIECCSKIKSESSERNDEEENGNIFSAGILSDATSSKLVSGVLTPKNLKHKQDSSSTQIQTQQSQQQQQQQQHPPSQTTLPNRGRSHSVMSLKDLGTTLPESIVEMEQRNITKVCLTGGPCAGKTSGLAYLSEKLRDDDINVFMVPEAATLLANGGGMLDFAGYSQEEILSFQKVLIKVQISLEDSFFKLAQLSKSKSVMLCDRGLLDGKAFLTDAEWDSLLKDLKFTEQEIRDKRYDSVIHMVTAADGADEHYLVEGARFQNAQEAVKIDKKFQDAWLGHQSLEVIDNRSVNGFEEKLNKLLFTVRKSSGLPVKGKKLYKRFVIGDPERHPNLPDDLQVIQQKESLSYEGGCMHGLYIKIGYLHIFITQVESFDIEDSFLYNPGHDEKEGKLTKVRKRIHKGEEIYLCSESHVIEGKNTMFFKKRLNYREYQLVKDRQDRDRVTIRKNRRQFIYQGYFYALDKFKDFDMCILRLKNSSEVDENLEIIPEFLQVDADVTSLKEFKSVNLSLKSSPLRDSEQLKQLILEYYEKQKDTFAFTNKLRPRK